MSSSEVWRVRCFSNLPMERQKRVTCGGIQVTVDDVTDYAHPTRILTMPSLTEGIALLIGNPTARLHIYEEVEIPRGDPKDGRLPVVARSSVDLKWEGNRLVVMWCDAGYVRKSLVPGIDCDFSRLPTVDPGGRHKVKFEEVMHTSDDN